MGINAVFVCPKHKLQHTPLRGNEGAAFQALIRIHPECFKIGNIQVWNDGYWYQPDWDDFFPGYDSVQTGDEKEYYQHVIDLVVNGRWS